MTNSNYDPSLQQEAPVQKIDVRKLIQTLRERIWLVVAICIFSTAAGAIIALKSTHIYRARTIVQIELDQSFTRGPEGDRPQEANSRATPDFVNTVANGIRTIPVMKRAIQLGNLLADPALNKGGTNAVDAERLAKTLAGMVDVKVRSNSRMIDISVDHPNASLTAKIANAVAMAFIKERIAQKMQNADTMNQALLEKVEPMRKKVQQSETKLHQYAESHNAVSLDEKTGVANEKLKEFNRDWTEAKSKRLALEADLKEIQRIADDPKALLSLQSVLLDPGISDMRAKLVAQEALVSSMTNRYKPKYPKMIDAQNKLVDIRNALNQMALNAPRKVQADHNGAQAREQKLAEAVKLAEKEVFQLGGMAIEYNDLKRQVDTERKVYEAVLNSIQQSGFAAGMEKPDVSVVEQAYASNMPVKPDRKRIVAGSLIVGLFASLLLVYFLNQLDTSIRTVDDAEKSLRLPVLGAIPVDKNSEHKLARLVMANEPHSLCAEAFRSLRAAIGLLGRGEQKKVVLFTSAVPAEGKTFSCVNYAICQGQQGVRVLLIDFDLRRPAVSDTFSMPSDTPGVTSYLLGKDSLKNLAIESKYQNVWVLPAGPQIPNPAEQLETPWVSQLLAEAAGSFDRVIIDTAPLNAVSDTTYLLKFAQVVNMVVRAGKTPEKAIQRALEMIRRAGTVPSGIILNHLPQSSGYGYYYYYSSKDGYRSKGVYGAREREQKQ